MDIIKVILTSILSAAALFVIAKILGHKQMSQLDFFDYITDICQAMDVPTPVLTKTHIFNFAKFNHVKFIPRDFVESLGYDQLFLENLP